MNRLTEAQLDELEAALAAGTPGPMRVSPDGSALLSDDPPSAADQIDCDRAFLARIGSSTEFGPGGWYDGGKLVFESCDTSDARMFAALHAAAPALLFELRELRRQHAARAQQPPVPSGRPMCKCGFDPWQP